jgi:methanogenic corrinoid protein MtbC1
MSESIAKSELDRFERTLLSLDRLMAQQTLQHILKSSTPLALVEQLIVPSLERIGEKWERGEVALSQVYMSGRICEELVDQLFLSDGFPRRDVNAAIVVLEDYHLLGKRIVYAAMRASGFELLDYGRLSVDEVVQRVPQDGVKILLISTLMLSSALRVQQVRKQLGQEVKLLVGGAPFRLDDQLWQEVGADAMGKTAGQAVQIVVQWTGGIV